MIAEQETGDQDPQEKDREPNNNPILSGIVGTLAIPSSSSLSSSSLLVNPLVIVAATTATLVKGDTKERKRNDISDVVYIKFHPSGKVYVGRTSGVGTPEEVTKRRDINHHMNSEGYGPAIVHSALINAATVNAYTAIRGREQQVIDYYGGVGSPTVGNKIRGVSKGNLMGKIYWMSSNSHLGHCGDIQVINC